MASMAINELAELTARSRRCSTHVNTVKRRATAASSFYRVCKGRLSLPHEDVMNFLARNR
jgi:hypothetical protein